MSLLICDVSYMEVTMAALPECSLLSLVMRIHDRVEVCQALRNGIVSLSMLRTELKILQMCVFCTRAQKFAFHHAEAVDTCGGSGFCLHQERSQTILLIGFEVHLYACEGEMGCEWSLLNGKIAVLKLS